MMRGKRNLLRGHYNPTPKQRKYPNLQWAVVDGKRMKICTNCIRTRQKKLQVGSKAS
jgi:ribosomal protein L28